MAPTRARSRCGPVRRARVSCAAPRSAARRDSGPERPILLARGAHGPHLGARPCEERRAHAWAHRMRRARRRRQARRPRGEHLHDPSRGAVGRTLSRRAPKGTIALTASVPRVYYGWIVVAGLSITETVSWGILYYGFPVMLRPMQTDLGYSTSELTLALWIGLLNSALTARRLGRCFDPGGADDPPARARPAAPPAGLRARQGVGPGRRRTRADARRRREDGSLLGAGARVSRQQLHDEHRHGPSHPVPERPRLLTHLGGGDDRLDGRHAAAGAGRLRSARRALRPPDAHGRHLRLPGRGAGPARAGATPRHTRADGRHARPRERHGHSRTGHRGPRHLRPAPLRLHQRRDRARSERRARHRAVRRRAPAGGARRLRARLLAPGWSAHPGRAGSARRARPRARRMIAPARLAVG